MDADKERPKEIVYSLTGQGVDSDNPINNKFDIGRTSGEIFVLKVSYKQNWHGKPKIKRTICNLFRYYKKIYMFSRICLHCVKVDCYITYTFISYYQIIIYNQEVKY